MTYKNPDLLTWREAAELTGHKSNAAITAYRDTILATRKFDIRSRKGRYWRPNVLKSLEPACPVPWKSSTGRAA